MKGSSQSFGQVTSIASPPFELSKQSVLTVDISLKIRHDDDLPMLRVLIYQGDSFEENLFRVSTNGFEKEEFCAEAGKVVLVFEAVWGRHSSPLIAIANVTATDLDCDPFAPDIGMLYTHHIRSPIE